MNRLEPLTPPTSGFDIIPPVFDGEEVQRIAEALEDHTVTRSRAGARHLMRQPIAARLARDPRLIAIARRFLGSSAVPFRATLFDNPGVVQDRLRSPSSRAAHRVRRDD